MRMDMDMEHQNELLKSEHHKQQVDETMKTDMATDM